MSIFIPFNYQPVSTIRRVTSYTVPAGFYAYVTVYCDPTATFSIDGNIALQGHNTGAAGVDFAVSGVDQAISTVASYTVPTGYYFQGQVLLGSSTTVQIDGDNLASSSVAQTLPVSFTAGSGQVIDCSAGTASLTGASIRNSSPNDQQDTPVVGNFWVPAGTALTESGTCYMTVSLFNNVS